MTKYVHIVQVHPVELGEPNLHKVKQELEFDSKVDAEEWVYFYNINPYHNGPTKAVYLGRVNDETGEIE